MVFAFAAVLLNLFTLGVMGLVQELESRTKRIPERKPWDASDLKNNFLYLQDFPTIVLGDTVGLSFVDFGVLILAQNAWPIEQWQILIVAGAAITVTIGYYAFSFYCLPCYDSMHPKRGAVSWTGKLHLLYMAIQLFIAYFGLLFLALVFSGKIPWSYNTALTLAVALFGGTVYLSSYAISIIRLRRFSRFF